MTCVKKRSNIKVRNTTQLEKGDIYEDLVEKNQRRKWPNSTRCSRISGCGKNNLRINRTREKKSFCCKCYAYCISFRFRMDYFF
ncbi:transcriptional regulator [Listeria monocytogenes HPB2262]|nr:transcriptional regulator [Listeria monocytogenes HPB2262]